MLIMVTLWFAMAAMPRAQSPEPRAQIPDPRAQSPEPRAQSPEPRAQSLGWVARAAFGKRAALAAAIAAAVAFIAPTTHAQTVGCVWGRYERGRMATESINPTIHRYTGLTTYGQKNPHPLLRVTASGNVAGRTVTARIRVVNLRGKIGSLMRSGTAPALTQGGFAYAHSFGGAAGNWQYTGSPTERWDGDDWLWQWVFTGKPTATAGDHGFTLDTWWVIAFSNAQGFDFAPSSYNKNYTFADAIEYTCTVN
jgi:hypothetical protein